MGVLLCLVGCVVLFGCVEWGLVGVFWCVFRCVWGCFVAKLTVDGCFLHHFFVVLCHKF